MARRSDADWLRLTASKPLAMRQPLYEAARMLEIAARLETMQAENAALKTFLELSVQFMEAQGKGDVAGMVRLTDGILAVVAKLNAPPTQAVTTELRAVLPPTGNLNYAIVTGATTVERPVAPVAEGPALDDPSVVDADRG